MMKKITLLLMGLCLHFFAQAQVVDTFTMNYANNEIQRADVSNDLNAYSFLGGYQINQNFGPENFGSSNWLLKDFYRVGRLNFGGGINDIPEDVYQLSIDSLSFLYYHVKTDNAFDTLEILIYDSESILTDSVTGLPINPVQGNILWQQAIVSDTSILGANSFDNRRFLTVRPNLDLEPGQTFSVYMTYKGDTSNYIVPTFTFSNACTQNDPAALAAISFNTHHYRQFDQTDNGGSDFTGIWPGFFQFPNRPLRCSFAGLFQNWNLTAFVRSTAQKAAIEVLRAGQQTPFLCYGDQDRLVINTFGIDNSNLDNFVLDFVPSDYVQQDQNGFFVEIDSVLRAGIAILRDTVNNTEDRDTFLIPGIPFFELTPEVDRATIACGSVTNVEANLRISDSSTMGSLTWSNGDSAILMTSMPGTYTVTANVRGCEKTAEVEVTERILNEIDIPTQSDIICEYASLEIMNPAARTSGWNFSWTVTDGQGDTVFQSNDVDLLVDQRLDDENGPYDVTLIADSSTCSYTDVARRSTVDEFVATCLDGIDDGDDDGDGVPNFADVDNTNGEDSDGNGVDDDYEGDNDGDGIPDWADHDINGDGTGDNGEDLDNDGIRDNSGFVSANNISLTTDILIAPNPVKAQFQLSFELTERQDVQIQILNVEGKLVFEQKEADVLLYNQSIDVSHLASGTHFLTIKTAEGLASRQFKIVK